MLGLAYSALLCTLLPTLKKGIQCNGGPCGQDQATVPMDVLHSLCVAAASGADTSSHYQMWSLNCIDCRAFTSHMHTDVHPRIRLY